MHERCYVGHRFPACCVRRCPESIKTVNQFAPQMTDFFLSTVKVTQLNLFLLTSNVNVDVGFRLPAVTQMCVPSRFLSFTQNISMILSVQGLEKSHTFTTIPACLPTIQPPTQQIWSASMSKHKRALSCWHVTLPKNKVKFSVNRLFACFDV